MAVFADGNRQRLGVNRAAASLGLRLPDDASVVGFGDLPFVDWVNPRLTTVRTPLADMTVRAACTVPLLLSGQQPETAQAEVTIELVVRGSSGPPPVTGRAVERSQGARVGSA
jgi:LacI family transcriptional regulator